VSIKSRHSTAWITLPDSSMATGGKSTDQK
jgi:hypothetical protein